MTVVADAKQVGGTLSVERVVKRFGEATALGGVSLEIKAGEFFTLLGPSGCGKTTLLRIIAGLELPDQGRIVLLGKDLTGLPANQRPVNTVFQSYALFPHLSVYENIAFGLRSRRMAPAEVERRVKYGLEILQLEKFAARLPHQLSGGQKQRVALARALVNEPQVLLLDEPMSALDAKLRAEVQIQLRRLQQQLGLTFILVTHDQDEAMAVSDRIALMRVGHLEQSGTPDEVYEHPRTRFAAEFLGAANLLRGKRVPGGLEVSFGRLILPQTPAWEEGSVAIRPERVQLRDTEPRQNGLRVRVREAVYRGAYQEAWLEPCDLRIRTGPHPALRVGQELWAELPPQALVVLEE
ncbi:ABC transporter ATP-binding protein [Meiothermus granaticius]|uniref:Spermidine/putrescine import ATP-binding protein PotA n=1 Tax=Meiothermus granaticius NBRC 107808 TaxID=1227551 RepID=A0A399F989_9DEIN|nr:ABC transporter ATP-binding protein [Meiothermus granaticius]RIH93227.1 Spermidine/putrescine import ATP-binding protein PotA [Meiothermus granaticius NBRC 107808]GEM86454.1 spermidine/putrescine ABC transporter ATP-binding protein [Meiothermus granaticius NBRC 107808]